MVQVKLKGQHFVLYYLMVVIEVMVVAAVVGWQNYCSSNSNSNCDKTVVIMIGIFEIK